MKTRQFLIGLLFLTILFTGCTQNNKPQNFDYGTIENNKYLNSFFGLEILLPDNWVIQSREQTEHLSKVGKDLMVGDNKNLKAALDASEVNVANLLVVSQYEYGAAVSYNPNFALVAENTARMPGIKSGSDYLFHARKLLEQSQVEYDYIDDEFEKVLINGQEFYVMNCSIDYMGHSIKQHYYSTIINGFCLSTIISYTLDDQKHDLEKIIDSMKFTNSI